MFQTVVSDLKREKITARALKDAHFSVGTFWNQLDLADLYSVQRVKKNHVRKITVKSILCSGWEGLMVCAAASHRGHKNCSGLSMSSHVIVSHHRQH